MPGKGEEMGTSKDLGFTRTGQQTAVPCATGAGAQFKPGWLARTMHEAHIACITDHNPAFWTQTPLKFTLPISDQDAAEVYARMDARFKAWTGRTLSEYAASIEPRTSVAHGTALEQGGALKP